MLVSEVRSHLYQCLGRTEPLFFKYKNVSLRTYVRKRKDWEQPSFLLGCKSSPSLSSQHCQFGGGEPLPGPLAQQSTIRLEKYIQTA